MALYSTESLFLDGVNESVLVGDVLDITHTTAQSWSMWIKAPNTFPPTMAFMGKMEDTPGFKGYVFYTDGSGYIHCQFINDWTGGEYVHVRTTDYFFVPSDWLHVVVTKDTTADASGISVYVNGLLEATTTLLDNLVADITNTAGLEFGSRESASSRLFWEGSIAEFGIYDVELSQSDVDDLWNEKLIPDPSGLSSWSDCVGYWPLGTGDTSPTATDTKGSNDGTMTNMDASNIVYDNASADAVEDRLTMPFTQGGSSFTTHYKMRALQDPGPGYETWQVTGTPDFAGSGAGGPIQAGTAVVVATWDVQG